MKRRNLALVLTGLMAGSMILSVPAAASEAETESASEDGPITDEKMEFTLACQLSPNWGNPEDGEFWKNLEEETNIHINWITYSETEASEKFKLMMASGDYPDGFIGALGGDDNDVITYGAEGIYIPLNDLIDEYCPNFKAAVAAQKPELMNMITTADGNIYGMPSLLYNPDIYNNTFINKKWLDALGLDVPQTTDEFEAVLQAFKDKDPNGNGEADEIPMTFDFQNWGASDHGPYFGAFGYPLSPDYLIVDNGTVKYLGAEESFRKGAEWLNKLYSEDLIDKDVFTTDDSSQAAKVSSGVVGVFSSWDSTIAGDYMDDYVALDPLKGPDGDQNALVEGVTGLYKGRFMITDKCEHPEILMQWIDRFYKDTEVGLNATYGIGPDKEKAWYYDDDHNIVFNTGDDLKEEYERGQQQLPFAPAILDQSIVADALGNPAKNAVNEEYHKYAQKFDSGEWERYPSVYMTVDEKNDIATVETDLQNYSKQKLAGWIVGDSNVDDDWDGYLKELSNIGLEHYLEVKQDVYDRYKAE